MHLTRQTDGNACSPYQLEHRLRDWRAGLPAQQHRSSLFLQRLQTSTEFGNDDPCGLTGVTIYYEHSTVVSHMYVEDSAH